MIFLTEELGVAQSQVLKILVRSPKLLSYSMESMRGKKSYFEEGLKLDAEDVRKMTTAPTPEIYSSMLW